MNKIQSEQFLKLISNTYMVYMEDALKATKLRKKAEKFYDKHFIEPEDHDGFGGLGDSDQLIHQGMLHEAGKLTDPSNMLKPAIKGVQDILKDKKLTNSKWKIFSDASSHVVTKHLNDIGSRNAIISKHFYTGNEGGALIHCCAVEFVPKPK